MKILITGVTGTGCGKGFMGGKRSIVTTVHAVLDILRQEHEVDHRPVRPGECLDEYDRVIVVPATLGGFASCYLMGAAYAAEVAMERTIYLLDDWQCAKIQGSMEGFLRNADKNWERFQIWTDLDDWKKHRDLVDKGIERLGSSWTRPVMAPTFGGRGRVEDLGIRTHFPENLLFDPSIHFENIYGTKALQRPLNKEFAWVFTSLTNRTRWITDRSWRWEMRPFGNKASGHMRLKEQDLVNEQYLRAWGVLSPPTGLATGLWWRARYQHAVEAGCVLVGDVQETKFLGGAYSWDASAIELSSVDGLLTIVDAQKQAFYAQRWSREQLEKSLQEFMYD